MDRVYDTKGGLRVTLGELWRFGIVIFGLATAIVTMKYDNIATRRELADAKRQILALQQAQLTIQKRNAEASFTAEDGEELRQEVVGEVRKLKQANKMRFDAIEDRFDRLPYLWYGPQRRK